MLYAVGHAACQFYEAKRNQQNIQACLAAAQTESEKYLQGAITQEAIMDQILVHVVLAGNPGKTWGEILPDLQALGLSPNSIEVISANIESPLSLQILLEQISHEFALPLLAQCHKLAQIDGITTAAEARVIEIISKKFEIDVDALK